VDEKLEEVKLTIAENSICLKFVPVFHHEVESTLKHPLSWLILAFDFASNPGFWQKATASNFELSYDQRVSFVQEHYLNISVAMT